MRQTQIPFGNDNKKGKSETQILFGNDSQKGKSETQIPFGDDKQETGTKADSSASLRNDRQEKLCFVFGGWVEDLGGLAGGEDFFADGAEFGQDVA